MSTDSRRRWYQTQMERLRLEFGGRCSDCGGILDLQFAHIVTTGLNGRGRGRAERIHDIRRNRAAYRLLCRRCHRAFDREHGPRLPKEAPF